MNMKKTIREHYTATNNLSFPAQTGAKISPEATHKKSTWVKPGVEDLKLLCNGTVSPSLTKGGYDKELLMP